MTNLSKLLVNDLKAVTMNNPHAKKLKKADLVDVVAGTLNELGFEEEKEGRATATFVATKPELKGLTIFIFSHRDSHTGKAYAVIMHYAKRKQVDDLNELLFAISDCIAMISRAERTLAEIKKQAPEFGVNRVVLMSYSLTEISVLLDAKPVKFGIGSEYSVMNTLHEHMEELEQENECIYCNGGVCINCSPEQFLDEDQLEELGLAETQVSPELEMLEAVNEAFPNARFEGVGEDGEYTYFFGSTALDKADMTICVFGKDGENKFTCTLEWEKEIHFDEHETVNLSEKECVTSSEVVEFIRKESKKAYRKKKKNA